jgi:hypothetical protein
VSLSPNPPWHHCVLNQQLIDRILDALPKVLVQEQVAHLCGIAPQRLSDWIKFGKRDMEANLKDSIFADFYQQYHEKKAEVLHKKLVHLASCPKNYGAITWILEKCYKEDFKTKSESQEQLEDYVFNVIKPLLEKGEHSNGKEKERREETEEEIL